MSPDRRPLSAVTRIPLVPVAGRDIDDITDDVMARLGALFTPPVVDLLAAIADGPDTAALDAERADWEDWVDRKH